MRPITRVLLSRMPPILRDILEHAIRQETDLVLLGGDGDPTTLQTLLYPAPDVVIVGTSFAGDPRIPSTLLRRWPRALVMMVAPDGGQATLCRLRVSVTGLGSLSPAELVERIRVPRPR